MFRLTFFLGLLLLCGVNAQDSCTTPERRTGQCINVHNCKAVIDILKQRPLSKDLLNYINSLQCGFEGSGTNTTPKVCCEQQTIGTSVTLAPPPETSSVAPVNVTNHRNLQLLDHKLCGSVIEQKIFGGNKTGVLEFPWMALMTYDSGSGVPEYRCGGTLINKRYVLTAAHCVALTKSNIRLVGVRLGEHDIATEVDCDKGPDGTNSVCAEKYQDIGIENTHVHPEYSRERLQNDIALIRLDRDADLRPPTVRPICLPIGTATNMMKKNAKVTGWGMTELGPRSTELLQVSLSLVEIEDCARVYRKQPIWYKQICAGGKKGMDSCAGDSGGPLQSQAVYNDNSKLVQYGIVSFGPTTCGSEGVPGVYTRVAYYVDWILDNMKA